MVLVVVVVAAVMVVVFNVGVCGVSGGCIGRSIVAAVSSSNSGSCIRRCSGGKYTHR